MLLNELSNNGYFHNANFIASLRGGAGHTYRGDLVLEGDFGVPPNERTPPKQLLTQAILLASDTALTCVAGALDHLSQVEALFATYGQYIDAKCRIALFVRDVPSPQKTSFKGVSLLLFPNEDTLIWNDLLDVLCIEKGDLKSLSPEAKVQAVDKALAGHKSPYPEITWEQALSKRVERKPLERVGAI